VGGGFAFAFAFAFPDTVSIRSMMTVRNRWSVERGRLSSKWSTTLTGRCWGERGGQGVSVEIVNCRLARGRCSRLSTEMRIGRVMYKREGREGRMRCRAKRL